MKKVVFYWLVTVLCLASFATAQYDSSLFSGMKARSIGPAGMSGRIASIDAVKCDPNIIYVGAATGGVWKSINGGITWNSIFDDQSTGSIGSVAIFQKNPNIVWVGTGESNVRNSVGVGRGIFKSIDAGKTWQFFGLEKAEKIARVILHPENADIAWVAAMGTTWGENKERGVYKTTDGGKTWKQVLYVDEKTGAAELVMDPSNPNKLLCGMWEHRRYPWYFKSGGTSSGLHISTDGGDTWKKQTTKDGLPEGELGRIALSFSRNKTSIVYALVEASESVLLRSDDGGDKWRTVNKEKNVHPRPFYFSTIDVNPVNENIVYRTHTTFDVSEDGGKNFSLLTPYQNIHPDFHALWMHPNGEMMIAGNDGGLAFTYDRGKTWRFVQNLPVGQFYHISYDMEYPYNIYGGLQDNGSWRGPSTTFKRDAIYNDVWDMVAFGDGFDTEPDPENADFGYAMSQGGALVYFNHKTGLQKFIRPTESAVKHRYNWNAGFALDPFDAKTIYYGSQFLHKSTDKGDTWEIISPDLTTNDTTKINLGKETGGLTLDVSGAENHCTILTIAPSSVKRGVIWVGTDDGNVQVTQDGGKTWTLVSKNKSIAAPAGTWVPHIEASKFDAGTAYVVFDDHRRSNWSTYVYGTRDFGKTWTNLATKEIDGFVHCFEEDPVNKDLLWLGTEYGLYVSFNSGKNWMKWRAGVPTVPVYDLATHPREHDLIIGTHGRGIYLLDDITPLRKFAENSKKNAHLYEVNPGYQYNYSFWSGSNATGPGNAAFKGEQRPYGSIITYFVNTSDSIKALEDTPKEPKMKIEILDKDSVIRVIKGGMKRGMNRVAWDLSRGAFKGISSVDSTDLEASGIYVLPGMYTVRMRYNGQEYKQSVEVKNDPRFVISTDGRKAMQTWAEKAGELQTAAATVYQQITESKKSITAMLAVTGNLDSAKSNPIKRLAESAQKKMSGIQDKIQSELSKQGFNDNSDELLQQIGELQFYITSHYEAPTQQAKVKYERLRKMLEGLIEDHKKIQNTDIPELQKLISNAGVNYFKQPQEIKLNK
ncbi:hypothetical protein L6Q79_02735 [bacterium]|nr:hypothetical protein [bacterium]NUN44743.1 hypothetical protein [bacterium]